jgi:hypothetical protein
LTNGEGEAEGKKKLGKEYAVNTGCAAFVIGTVVAMRRSTDVNVHSHAATLETRPSHYLTKLLRETVNG